MILFNRSEFSPLPESQWLSVGTITDQVQQLGEPFRTTIQVLIEDGVSDVIPDVAPDRYATSAMTRGAKIYLFREWLADGDAVERTFWHDLLHFGLRRFLTRDQYIQHLGELYAQDAWVRKYADAWIAGEGGRWYARRRER